MDKLEKWIRSIWVDSMGLLGLTFSSLASPWWLLGVEETVFGGGATGRFAANLLDSGYHSDQIEGLTVDLESERPALVWLQSYVRGSSAKLATALGSR